MEIPGKTTPEGNMFALFETIQVNPEHRDVFIEATMGGAKSSNNDELGCLRFGVLQDNSDSNKMYLFFDVPV